MSGKVLVTGAAGFMGSWLVDRLLAEGHEVVGVDDLSGGYMENVNPGCTFVKGDLRDTAFVGKLVRDIDVIFHLAAYAAEGQSVFSPIEINEINIRPMNNLLVSAVNNGVGKFVFTSSMAVYGRQTPPFDESMPRRPEDPYGAAKAYCENMLEIFHDAHGLDYTIIRPHNVYGPRQNMADPFRNVLGIWINRIMHGRPPIIYGDGEQVRAFSWVESTSEAIARAGQQGIADSQIINVGSPRKISINEACRLVLHAMHSDMQPLYEEARPQEVKYAYCTTAKSEELLGYRERYTLEEGVMRMVEWARSIGPQEPTYRLPLEITRNAPRVWVEKLM